MEDPRWRVVPLAARGLWAELSVLADRQPELRSAAADGGIGLEALSAHLGALPCEVLGAASHLAHHGAVRMLPSQTIILEAY